MLKYVITYDNYIIGIYIGNPYNNNNWIIGLVSFVELSAFSGLGVFYIGVVVVELSTFSGLGVFSVAVLCVDLTTFSGLGVFSVVMVVVDLSTLLRLDVFSVVVVVVELSAFSGLGVFSVVMVVVDLSTLLSGLEVSVVSEPAFEGADEIPVSSVSRRVVDFYAATGGVVGVESSLAPSFLVLGAAFSAGAVDGADVVVVVVVVVVIRGGVIVSDLTVIFSASRPLSLKKADVFAAFCSPVFTTFPRSAKSTEPPSSFAFSFIFAVLKDSSLSIFTLPCLKKRNKAKFL